MTWYINRGDDIKKDQTIKLPFLRTLSDNYNEQNLVFTDELLQSEMNTAPPYPVDRITKVNCTLTADLRTVDRSLFKKRTGADGLTYYDVHYDLVITMQPAIMKFSLEFRGKEMGSVVASYD
jgi:hypothetical protein